MIPGGCPAVGTSFDAGGRFTQVFDFVVQGLPNKQIAGRLGTTEQTVKVHRGRVMQKMQASSVAQLVHIAARLEAGDRFAAALEPPGPALAESPPSRRYPEAG